MIQCSRLECVNFNFAKLLRVKGKYRPWSKVYEFKHFKHWYYLKGAGEMQSGKRNPLFFSLLIIQQKDSTGT